MVTKTASKCQPQNVSDHNSLITEIRYRNSICIIIHHSEQQARPHNEMAMWLTCASHSLLHVLHIHDYISYKTVMEDHTSE